MYARVNYPRMGARFYDTGQVMREAYIDGLTRACHCIDSKLARTSYSQQIKEPIASINGR